MKVFPIAGRGEEGRGPHPRGAHAPLPAEDGPGERGPHRRHHRLPAPPCHRHQNHGRVRRQGRHSHVSTLFITLFYTLYLYFIFILYFRFLYFIIILLYANT